MSSYCTIDQLKNTLGTAKDLIVTQTEDSEFTEIIEQNSGLIDDYIRGKVNLPFEETPVIIKTICLELARYEVYARKANNDVPEIYKKTYENAFKLLEKISTGLISLGVQTEIDTESNAIQFEANDQVFGVQID